MILSDDEVKERLSSDRNLCVVIEKKRYGNQGGAPNIPESVRELISITKNTGDDGIEEVAEAFGVSTASVSRFSRGLVGGDRVNERLLDVTRTARIDKSNKLIEREEDAHEAALDVLMTSLTSLQPRLLDPELSARDVSTIAKNMSAVAKDMRGGGRDGNGTTNNTQVILFAPPRKKLSTYEFTEG